MLASHKHEQLLGGSRVEARLSSAAEQKAAAQEGCLDAYMASHVGSSDQQSLTSTSAGAACVIRLLAAWKNVSIEQMAQRLLDLTPRQRTEMREEYAKQVS